MDAYCFKRFMENLPQLLAKSLPKIQLSNESYPSVVLFACFFVQKNLFFFCQVFSFNFFELSKLPST